MTYKLSIEELKKSLPPNVSLLAVSKGHPDCSIRQFAQSGQIDFGESRLQEALPKIENLKDINQIRWHFVGKLQKNKVRKVLKDFDVVQSVDTLPLIKRISRIAGEESIAPELMLQVKLRDDPSKSGFSKEDLFNAWSQIKTLPHINLIGLMTISPIAFSLKERKSLFMECRDLANYLGLKDCSMGMSNDWEEAVEAGSTWIRIGSLLFGQRSK